MDPLESYLDRVCRGIAGPRSLRAHIRQELREHLKDAAAEHVAAGLSEADALARAIEEFGGPDEVRAELEATHGHRFLTVVIDKAMSWKEKTMKARWVWSIWAHVAIVLTIILEVLFIAGIIIFIVPKFREMVKEEAILVGPGGNEAVNWGEHFLASFVGIVDLWPWLVLAAVIGWLAFERFIKSENKSLIRLAKLGTVSAALLVVSFLASTALILPLIMSFPDIRGVSPVAAVTLTQRRLDKDMARLADAVNTSNGQYTMRGDARDAADMITRLRKASEMPDLEPSPAGLPNRYEQAQSAAEELREAIAGNDKARIQSALKNLQDAYATLRAATSQPAPRTP